MVRREIVALHPSGCSVIQGGVPTMKLSHRSLKTACYEVASITMSARQPVDVASIEAVAEQFLNITEVYEDFVTEQGRDSNLIVRAVHYLADKHAIPPLRDNTQWFSDMFEVLVELACPNTGATKKSNEFLRDVEDGIAVSWLNMTSTNDH